MRITRNIHEVKLYNKQTGGFWFEPDTVRFFSSRVTDDVIVDHKHQRTWFVSSERQGRDYPRMYTVRYQSWETGSIDTHGEFQAYCNKRTATKAALEAAKGA